MFLDCRHVCKTCAFHHALQAGKEKEIHPPCSHVCVDKRQHSQQTFANIR
jgi:hypothetical protein